MTGLSDLLAGIYWFVSSFLSRDGDFVSACRKILSVSPALPTALSQNAPQLWASISDWAAMCASPLPLRQHVLLYHVPAEMRRRGLAPSCSLEACHLRYRHSFQRAARSAVMETEQEVGRRRIYIKRRQITREKGRRSVERRSVRG